MDFSPIFRFQVPHFRRVEVWRSNKVAKAAGPTRFVFMLSAASRCGISGCGHNLLERATALDDRGQRSAQRAEGAERK